MKKEKTLPPVRPNLGIEATYQKRLESLIGQMTASVEWWVIAAYRQNEPEMAQDALPANAIQKVLARLRKQWQGEFDEAAPNLAGWFVRSAQGRADKSFSSSLKTAGFSVKFDLTPAVKDIISATTNENVSLIKSISSQYFTEIERMVMRSVSVGGDVGKLKEDLKERYGVTNRRAKIIAQDQNAKATANVTRARQTELGIKRAIWVHSRGGRHPRKSHVEASGRKYLISEGCKIDGEFIYPGVLINCKCVSRVILPALDDGSD